MKQFWSSSLEIAAIAAHQSVTFNRLPDDLISGEELKEQADTLGLADACG